MDIACPGLYGLGNNMIHKFDDRCIAGVIQKVCSILNFADDRGAVLFHVLNQFFSRIPVKIVRYVYGGKNGIFC